MTQETITLPLKTFLSYQKSGNQLVLLLSYIRICLEILDASEKPGALAEFRYQIERMAEHIALDSEVVADDAQAV